MLHPDDYYCPTFVSRPPVKCLRRTPASPSSYTRCSATFPKVRTPCHLQIVDQAESRRILVAESEKKGITERGGEADIYQCVSATCRVSIAHILNCAQSQRDAVSGYPGKDAQPTQA